MIFSHSDAKGKKKNSSEPKFLRLKHEYNCLEMPVIYCVFATPYQSEKAGRLQAYDRRYILLTKWSFAQCLLQCLYEPEVFDPRCSVGTKGCPNDRDIH